MAEYDRAKVYTPPPPHPREDPSRGGGCMKEGGGYKTPAVGGLQNTHTHTTPP